MTDHDDINEENSQTESGTGSHPSSGEGALESASSAPTATSADVASLPQATERGRKPELAQMTEPEGRDTLVDLHRDDVHEASAVPKVSAAALGANATLTDDDSHDGHAHTDGDDDHHHGGHGDDGHGHDAHGHGDDGHGHGHGEHHHHEPTFKDAVRQTAIVAGLTLLLCLLHAFAVPNEGFDPTGMLALGFVVLASYTIGHLVEVIKLPHITGYLLAGLFFGPSVAHMLHLDFPPFDEGVLNTEIIGQLSTLNDLAVALIMLTAGGELKIETLKKGFRAIAGVLAGQLFFMVVLICGFLYAISGAFPQIALPGLGTLDTMPMVYIGLMLASISFATSPAATIAVISGSGAKGPTTQTTLSSVVLKDVIVVVGFTVSSVLAGQELGRSTIEGGLASYLFIHVVISLVVGAVVGGGMALYLRFVGREILLFIVAVVYVGTFAARQLHLDPVLLYLAAGFTVANFSKSGDQLIHSVEQLAMPVYVVFFTLAGAGLHLDEVGKVLPFAIALVLLRMLAMWLGTKVGGSDLMGRANETMKRYGWLGFISQAGVALTLANATAAGFGNAEGTGIGNVLSTLIIAGVAFNELLGPVLLKVGLGKAGELPKKDTREDVPHAAHIEGDEDEWEAEIAGPEVWGPAPDTGSAELDGVLTDVTTSLDHLAATVAKEPMTQLRRDGELFIRELRREYLRYHRRVTVLARETESDVELAAAIRTEQVDLTDHWRSVVLARGARLSQKRWSPASLVPPIDELVSTLPEQVKAPYPEDALGASEDESMPRRLRRWWLGFKRVLGGAQQRPVRIQELARYHLSGTMPMKLEALAALMIQSDRHLGLRARGLFSSIVADYNKVADELLSEHDADATKLLRAARAEAEENFELASNEVRKTASDGGLRAARILGRSARTLKEEARIYDTPDLVPSQRRSSRVLAEREEALELLTDSIENVRKASPGGYALVGLELELIALEAHVEDALRDHATHLANQVSGRTHLQVDRVAQSLRSSLSDIEEVLAGRPTSAEVEAVIHSSTTQLIKTTHEASESTAQLRDQLMDESCVAPLVESIKRSASTLTNRYEVTPGRMAPGEWKLPSTSDLVEVPLRELVISYVDTRIAPELIAIARDTSTQVSPLIASLRELERMVAFNAEIAAGELEDAPDAKISADSRSLLKEMVVGAFDRTLDGIEGHAVSCEAWGPELGERLRSVALGSVESLREELVGGNVSRQRIESMKRAAAGKRFIQRAGRFRERAALIRTQLGEVFRRMVGAERMDRWRLALGLPAGERPVMAQVERFEPFEDRSELPVVYRRLFASETLEAGDVLLGRDDAILHARETLTKQKSGHLRSVAVIGPDGCGKSAVAAAIIRRGNWKAVRRIRFDHPPTSEELDNVLKQAPGSLNVIEGIHWLISSRPGGFEPLRRFIAWVSDDDGKSAWLLHIDSIVWMYAKNIAPMASTFPEQVRLEPLTLRELEAAVLARHGLSGYGLTFEAHVSNESESVLVRQAMRLRRPYETYFHDLHVASGGLIRDALRLWLASVESVDDDLDSVTIGRVPAPISIPLRRLDEELLMQLAPVARQGWIDAKTHSHLFRVDLDTAEARLRRLTHMGLLTRDGEAYRIANHVRGPVSRVLLEAGWTR